MAPNKRFDMACKEMKKIGISEEIVKPVLTRLLALYENNWKLIEDENYQVLLDAILDDFSKREEPNKHDWISEDELEDSEPPLKRNRLRNNGEASCSVPEHGTAFISPSEEPYESQPCPGDKRYELEKKSSPGNSKEEEKGPSLPQRGSLDKVRSSDLFSDAINLEDDDLEDRHPNSVEAVDVLNRLKKRSIEAMDSEIGNEAGEVPQSVNLCSTIPPVTSEDGSSRRSSSEMKDNQPELWGSKGANVDVSEPSLIPENTSSAERCSNLEGSASFVKLKEVGTENKDDGASRPLKLELASSADGDVKLNLTCNISGKDNFCIPNLDAVLKLVEEKYLKSHINEDPGFSIMKVMKDICDCFSAERTNSKHDEGERSLISIPSLSDTNSDKISDLNELDCMSNRESFHISPDFPYGSIKIGNFYKVIPQIPRCLKLDTSLTHGVESTNKSSLVVFQEESSDPNLFKVPYYVDDITKGFETVKIPLVNEYNDEKAPDFKYLAKNVPHQNAYVRFVLARISDENCCSNCVGDCMSQPVPCACAGETGGEFAYTPAGLVQEQFLEKCISINGGHKQKHLYYCKDCPLERSRNKKFAGKCKGHLVRTFIKECWYKCACSMRCGNRVVQKGITKSLQVFMTSKGKGWGIRTLEELPKGAFVCEYVGEIVTNMELHRRNIENNRNERHTYPVLLDADWGSEGVLKDEEALCLDATNYGNVARFINHRCSDANLVEIPVEVETPDHHYYHLAFFTTRKVDALEELTWDYGIDFKDRSHPVKAFRCQCSSKLCRDVKHKRGRSSS